MIKKLSFVLMGLLCFSFSSFATTYHYSLAAINFKYDFKPGDVQEFQNPLFWEASASCTLTTEDNADPVRVTLLAKEGRVNGRTLRTGDEVIFDIHSGDHFDIKASAYAKVRLVNEGMHTIHAQCEV